MSNEKIEKLDMKTVDFVSENIAKIAEIFPNVATESIDEDGNVVKAIDFEALKQELSENIIEGYKERYSLNWAGKKEAQLSANTPTTKILRPCKEESVDFDTTENLYIEGDNLEVLKILQESYMNKIKMIYIDPPYNTGKDFVYKDNFTKDKKEELIESGQIDEDGGRLVANLDSNGRYHSDWLSMMYPRLKLARNLLKEDGVIFISIDDNEVHNLRKICDEVFGEDNFIAKFVWKKRSGGGYSNALLSVNQEYILMYSKTLSPKIYDKPKSQEWIEQYYNFKDEKSNYKRRDLRKSGTADRRVDRPTMFYEIISPENTVIIPKKANGEDGRWTFAEETFKDQLAKNEIEFVKVNNEWKVYYKERPIDENGNIKTEKWETILTEIANNTQGTGMIETLFGDKNVFDFPKPFELIKFFANIATKNEDIILDFFSGSSSSAQATMKLNSEDNGNRKFIMVQLPEETDEKSEAYKAGYKTIPEIGKERIRRAGKKIVEESDKTDLDIGFRVLKLDSSNMKEVYFNPSEISQQNLFESVDNIKEDRSNLDLLFGVLIDWGVDLTLPITKETIQGKTCYFVDEDSLCACFENNIDEEFIKELASKDMLRVVFKDSSFGNNDDLKDNVSQIFKQLNPNVDIKVI